MDQEQKKKELRRKAMQLPLSPGVYIMHNRAGDIIYIGKAKALKNRVSQYFGSEKNHDNKVRRMVSNVDWFEYILCDSEFEALVLESSLIKQHKPKYNILLKDDKGYSYVRVSQGPWPRITQVKQVEEDGAQYIGPYMSSWSTKQTVDSALKIFKLPDCSRKFPQDFGKGRPCLNYYIKQCCAPCRGKVTEAEYNEAFQEAVDFIKGGSSSSVKVLTEKMEQAAENLEFELAARLRDRINAIQAMKERNVPQWYIDSCFKIKYMFPKAHAAAYVMMAWRIAWFKVNYPLEYYTAFFSIRADDFSYEMMCFGKERVLFHINEISKVDKNKRSAKDEGKLKDLKIVLEMYARGYDFVPIDIYKAKADRFQIIDGKIMPSFASIEGMGEKAAQQLYDAAQKGPFLSKEEINERAKIGKGTIEKMSELGILDGMPETNQLSLFDFM